MIKFFNVANEEPQYDDIEENDSIIDEPEKIWQIAVDILETRTEIIILAPIAGIELEDIDIFFHNNILSIKWQRQKPEVYSSRDIILRNSECYWWVFSRNIILPENLDFESIKATLENGILIINIPKLKFSSQSIKIEKVL